MLYSYKSANTDTFSAVVSIAGAPVRTSGTSHSSVMLLDELVAPDKCGKESTAFDAAVPAEALRFYSVYLLY